MNHWTKLNEEGEAMRRERQRSVTKGRTMCRLTNEGMADRGGFEPPTP